MAEEGEGAGPGIKKAAKRRVAGTPEGGATGVFDGDELRRALASADVDEAADKVARRVAEMDEEAGARKEALTKKVGFHFRVTQKDDSAILRPDLARIVETVWVEDMHATWQLLKQKLRVGAKRSEHAHLQRSLDDVRQVAFDAHCLYATAKRERDRWEAANDVHHSAMWNRASQTLQAEKEQGLRSKQITDADVKAMAIVLFKDEYAAQERRRREVQLTVDLIGELASLATKRADDLQVMLGKLRG